MENEALVLDLVEWIAECPRPYDEVMAAWRTTCPRLTVWEDTIDAGLVEVVSGDPAKMVRATVSGRAFLDACRRAKP